MDETLIYAKTPRGSAEVSMRVGGLSLQERRILIMIDGARSLGELAPLVPKGTLDEVIGLLQSRGMIRLLGEDGAPAPGSLAGVDTMRPTEAPTREPVAISGTGAGAGAAPASAQERVYLPIDEIKRRAVRELNERLGLDAAAMALRIEISISTDELRELLREAERLIARMAGEIAAEEFVRAMRRH
jgi:hypothetical protein